MAKRLNAECRSGYCAVPITLDTYNTCNHNCMYCYARFSRRELAVNHSKAVNVSIDNQLNGEADYFLLEQLKINTPIMIGNMADVFPDAERKLQTSYKTIKKLLFYGKYMYLTTKAVWWSKDEKYFNLIKENRDRIAIKVSFSTFDDKTAMVIEPNAPLPSERLAMLEKLSKVGVSTVARIEPFIMGFFIPSSLSKLKGIVERVTVRPLTLSLCTLQKTAPVFNAIGMNQETFIREYESKEQPTIGTFHWVNYDVEKVYPLLQEMKTVCNKFKIKFGVDAPRYTVPYPELNDGEYCCQVSKKFPFDKLALCYKMNKDPDGFAEKIIDEVGNNKLSWYYEINNKTEYIKSQYDFLVGLSQTM